MDFTTFLELAKLLGQGMSKLLAADKVRRVQTAEHFNNLAVTFSEFEPALTRGDTAKVNQLLARTRELVLLLAENETVRLVVGKTKLTKIVTLAHDVQNAKEALATLQKADPSSFSVINQAIGHLEAHVLTLRASARRAQ